MENVTKLVFGILSTLIVGSYVWVWNTNVKVEVAEVQKQHIIENVDRLEDDQKEMKKKQEDLSDSMSRTEKRLYGMERDIEYIKQGIDDIRKKMDEKN